MEPRNRAERRAAQGKGRGRPPKAIRLAMLDPLPPPPSPNAPQLQAIAGSDVSEDDRVSEPVHDKPPAGQGAKGARSHHAGVSKRTRVASGIATYHLMGGGLLARLDPITGQVVMEKTPPTVDAWMVVYDADPMARKWMEYLTIGSPWLGVALAYAGIAGESLSRHGTSLGDLFKPKEPAPPAAAGPNPELSQSPAPATGPIETPLGAMPEEGLPHDVELMVRQLARETGQSYDTVRAAALEQMAEFTAAQNGGSGRTPRALGEIVG